MQLSLEKLRTQQNAPGPPSWGRAEMEGEENGRSGDVAEHAESAYEFGGAGGGAGAFAQAGIGTATSSADGTPAKVTQQVGS